MANRIRELITERGLRFSEVIERSGLAKSTFYDITNGTCVPRLENARAIAKAMDVSIDELFPDKAHEDESEK